MADSLSAEIRASLTWLFQDTLDLAVVSDASRLEYSASLADGAGADQADKIWHDRRRVTGGGGTDSLDLTALANTLFGNTISIAMAKVKVILIVNRSTAAGEYLMVGGAAANAFAAPFGGDGDAKVLVGPDSVLLLSDKKDGWTVAAGTGDILCIQNLHANDIDYEIVIIGTSA
ncbi:MAG: hypothetical protein ACYC35_23910 [Pirellulales bacterium]